MKAISLNYIAIDCNINVKGQGQTNECIWTEELIEQELDQILSGENIKQALLDVYFPKSDFTIEDVESLLGLYGELNEESDTYSLTWWKFND